VLKKNKQWMGGKVISGGDGSSELGGGCGGGVDQVMVVADLVLVWTATKIVRRTRNSTGLALRTSNYTNSKQLKIQQVKTK
jgi:hypothetical protein